MVETRGGKRKDIPTKEAEKNAKKKKVNTKETTEESATMTDVKRSWR